MPELSGLVPEYVGPERVEVRRELTETEKDFAAKQREISRNLLASVSSEKDAIEGTEDSDSAKVKRRRRCCCCCWWWWWWCFVFVFRGTSCRGIIFEISKSQKEDQKESNVCRMHLWWSLCTAPLMKLMYCTSGGVYVLHLWWSLCTAPLVEFMDCTSGGVYVLHLWWSLYTLYLLACQVRVTVGN